MIVAGKVWPQLVQRTIFQLVYASFSLRVVICEPLGLFITTIWKIQPGILANRSVPSVLRVDLAVVTGMSVFTLDRSVSFSKGLICSCSVSNRDFHHRKSRWHAVVSLPSSNLPLKRFLFFLQMDMLCQEDKSCICMLYFRVQGLEVCYKSSAPHKKQPSSSSAS